MKSKKRSNSTRRMRCSRSAWRSTKKRIRSKLVELPAQVSERLTGLDALIRQIPGVLNDIESVNQDSFVNGLLDHPSFTRPESVRGLKVPDILLSGDHEKIRIWRLKESLKETKLKRPDLLINKSLTKEESRLLIEIEQEQEPG